MGREKQDEKIKKTAEGYLEKLAEKHKEDFDNETKRYREQLEAKRAVQIAADQEELAGKHIVRPATDKEKAVTLWDEAMAQADKSISGHDSYASSRAFSLILALAKAVTVSFQQTIAEYGVQSWISNKIGEKLGDTRPTPKPGMDIAQYNVHFKDGKVAVDPLKIDNKPIEPVKDDQGKVISDPGAALDTQFNTFVQIWLFEHGYEPSTDPQEKGTYVNIDDHKMSLNEDKFNELNQGDTSLANFLETRTGLKFEGPAVEPAVRPSPV